MTSRNNANATDQLQKAVHDSSDYSTQATDRASEVSGRMRSNITQMGRQVKSKLDQIHVNETTIPDAFHDVPKVISPRMHKWIDIGVIGYFVGLGLWCAIRGKAGAAVAAFINGGMVAAVTTYTDYDGDMSRPINFKVHATLDAAQATTAALAPVLYGFADEPEAKYFWIPAAKEVGVIAVTDWDAGMPAGRRHKGA